MSEKDLQTAIEKLNASMEKSASKRETFWRGVVYGLGFFIGGTILVALLTLILSKFNTAPLVGEYIEKVLAVINSK